MAREPSYPKEAAVGSEAAGDESGGDSILAAAAAAQRAQRGGDGSKRTRHLMTGAAIGIGSAAIVAALLYANRRRDESGRG